MRASYLGRPPGDRKEKDLTVNPDVGATKNAARPLVAVFVVDETESPYCSLCDEPAAPSEKCHDTVPGQPGASGCGARFVAMTAVGLGVNAYLAAQRLRSDLEFVPLT